jgi:DNA invertase Pin-like site-specific DNA recombinase
VAHVFSEKVSGAKTGRPEYQAMVKGLRSGEYDGVVVFRIDRLGRNSREIMLLFDELDSKGIKVFSINENLDTTTAMGRAMRDLICVFAQLEREQISEATKHRLTALKNLGKKLGRPEVVSAELRGRMQELKNAGKSIRAISQVVGIKRSTVHRALSQKSTSAMR